MRNVKFSEIQLYNWRQFDNVHIRFHERLTIITGANGAGKTSVLNLLSRHFGWTIAFIATLSERRKGQYYYYSGINNHDGLSYFSNYGDKTPSEIGQIVYSDDSFCNIVVPTSIPDENLHPIIKDIKKIEGIYITSHRPAFSYQKVENIPTQIRANETIFDEYISNLKQYYNANARVKSPSFGLKSALISLATFGHGNNVVASNPEALETFQRYEFVLAKILPKQLKFRRIKIRLPDVIFECEGSEFSLDASSGGIAALLDLSWQLHMKSMVDEDFIAIIDEPENHLHPQLQREVLPNLLEAFPRAQFVVATHNPFVVTSSREANVVALDFDGNSVRSRHLSQVDLAASANNVLSEVLGVPIPLPIWVENAFNAIVDRYEGESITRQKLSDLHAQLRENGLDSYFPRAVDHLIPTENGND